jgi:hypothetical protein
MFKPNLVFNGAFLRGSAARPGSSRDSYELERDGLRLLFTVFRSVVMGYRNLVMLLQRCET